MPVYPFWSLIAAGILNANIAQLAEDFKRTDRLAQKQKSGKKRPE